MQKLKAILSVCLSPLKSSCNGPVCEKWSSSEMDSDLEMQSKGNAKSIFYFIFILVILLIQTQIKKIWDLSQSFNVITRLESISKRVHNGHVVVLIQQFRLHVLEYGNRITKQNLQSWSFYWNYLKHGIWLTFALPCCPQIEKHPKSEGTSSPEVYQQKRRETNWEWKVTGQYRVRWGDCWAWEVSLVKPLWEPPEIGPLKLL